MATDFPRKGDDRKVSLRNSNHARFPLDHAASLRGEHPQVWATGCHGLAPGDQQHDILARVHRQGGSPTTPAEEHAVRLREAWADANANRTDHPGICAQIQWLVTGCAGEAQMKEAMSHAKNTTKGAPDAQHSAPVNDRAHPGLALASQDPGGTPGRGASGNSDPEPAGSHGSPDALYLRASVVSGVRAQGAPETAPTNRFPFVASTESLDRHGTVLRCDWDLVPFSANPALLWMHGRMSDRPAIGHCENTKIDKTAKQLLSVAVFDDTTDFDREILTKYQKGVLVAFSVGFRFTSYRVEEIDGEEVLVLSGMQLTEISAVNVGSNPDALVIEEARNASVLARMLDGARAAKFVERAGAVPHATLPFDTSTWNAVAAEKRVRAWATGTDGVLDYARYAEAFGFVDPALRSDPKGYRFLHSDVVDGKLVTVRGGVLEAVRAVATSGLAEADLGPVRRHLAADLAGFGLPAPWKRGASAGGDRHLTTTVPSANTKTPLATRGGNGEPRTMSLKLSIPTSRATENGLACEGLCPACQEPIEVELSSPPLPGARAVELKTATDALAIAQKDLTGVRAELETLAKVKAADDVRLVELEALAKDQDRQISETLLANAARDLDALIAADKVTPGEREIELDLASDFLRDRTLTADKKGFVGAGKWAKRLAAMDARPVRGMLGTTPTLPVVDPNKPAGSATPGTASAPAVVKDHKGRSLGSPPPAGLFAKS